MINKIIFYIFKPLALSLLIALFCYWLNSLFSFNDRGVLIMALVGSLILIFPSYFIIHSLSKHRTIKKFFIFLTLFIGIPFVGYYADTSSYFRTSLLKEASIYNGPMPEPQLVYVPGMEIISMFPEQANLFTKPGTSVKKVTELVSSVGGKIITQIPTFGYYLIQTPKDSEQFISKIEEADFVLDIQPNIVLLPTEEGVVDFSNSGKNSDKLVSIILKSPDPSGILFVEIDVFKSNHYEIVNGVRESMGARGPVLQIDVSAVKCDKAYCSSTDRVYAALASVLAGAELNRQKVIINIPVAPMPLTKNTDIFTSQSKEKSNTWATGQWEIFAKGLKNIIQNSDWSKNGNVTVSQSAGNGSCLVNSRNSILDCAGADMSELMVLNQLAEDHIYFYGVEEKGKPAKYSNHGKNIIMKEIPAGTKGTSVATAIASVEYEKVWKSNPKIKAKEIKNKLTTVVCPFGLQTCGMSCIPKNAECCNPNTYCLKPAGSCLVQKQGTCSYCSPGQKFCGMFCVDITKECQKEVAEEKPSEPTQKTTNNKAKSQDQGLLCNGKYWSPCASDQQFYCPLKGDPYCDEKGKILCNGEYWKGCKIGEELQCFPEGPMCVPEGMVLTPLCAGKRGLPCGAGYHFICVASGGLCEPDENQQQLVQQPEQQFEPSSYDSQSSGKTPCQIVMEKRRSCEAVCAEQSDACSNTCGSDGICITNCAHQGRVCHNACYANCDGL